MHLPWAELSAAQPLAEDPSKGSGGCGFMMIICLFACTPAHPARTHPCAFSLPFALACMTGKMSYKQIKIETQKRANYNMFNYLFRNHSSSLLYSVPGNVSFVIWQGQFFFHTRFIPSLGWQGGHRVRTWGEVMKQGQTFQAVLTGDPKDQSLFALCSTAWARSSLSDNCECFFLLHANTTMANTDSFPTTFLPGRQAEVALPCLLPCCCTALLTSTASFLLASPRALIINRLHLLAPCTTPLR